ncbi:hypothetical protein IMF23_17145 [Chelatococcus daeguensis]|uniref:hypothetical protein n=1 Tax=Chelatococcus daeguensis TaxID=444444 RepID=UPI000A4A393B|nr:hypothetical protein [Chelatococcus daeguensis]MBM3085170.1 hypothetical protein [Chelatococcus daeguensis]
MDSASIAAIIRSEIPKSVMLDHAEVPGAARRVAAEKAREMGLSGRDARRSTGFNAHLVMERRLKEICEEAGGLVVEGRVFPGTELTLHQPLMQYGRVLLGRATVHERGGLPSANVTRRNGAKLNSCLGRVGHLFGVETDPNAPIHVLILTLSDCHELEKIAATYLAIIAPTFDSFLFRVDLDDFIGGYDESSVAEADASPVGAIDLGLEPRKGVRPYFGEEHRPSDNRADGSR